MEDDYSASQRSKFRFKSKRHASDSKSSSEDREKDAGIASSTADPRRRRRHRHHHRHHRSSKRHKSAHSPQPPDDVPSIPPDVAFRESLFDALADDEGASYWESVYGQPIHTYPRPDQGGELEQMTDEEYASYVRARMWEKTHEAVIEERERRRDERERKRQDTKRSRDRGATGMGSEREAFERMIDESLQRGQERKSRKRKANIWLDIWKRYLDSWEDLNARAQANSSHSNAAGTESNSVPSKEKLRNLIFWPVESGKRKDITPDAVEAFIRHAPTPTPIDTPASDPAAEHGRPRSHPSDLLTVLKIERVRWHPDKIQHRYGALGMEDQLVKSATEVFQILDRLWVEERERMHK
ncbi:hypothetical protein FQN52_009543 [Onygenales sp. PD_12]|nr:hypothetical protein FQN52_009543 [Onygenales sp. PD_12]